jgi:hypothetical protein
LQNRRKNARLVFSQFEPNSWKNRSYVNVKYLQRKNRNVRLQKTDNACWADDSGRLRILLRTCIKCGTLWRKQEEITVATVKIPDETLARLQAAAAARHVSFEAYLDEMAASDANGKRAPFAQFHKSTPAERAAAAESIRKLATRVKGKSTIKDLIADKHAGHKS